MTDTHQPPRSQTAAFLLEMSSKHALCSLQCSQPAAEQQLSLSPSWTTAEGQASSECHARKWT